MAKHKQRRSKRLPARVAQDYAALDQTLDRMETAMLAGQPAEAHAILDTVWQQRRQMPEVLTRRLIEGRAGIPFLAFDLLAGFAGERTSTYLRRIVVALEVPDIVRFGARRREGWPEDEREEAAQRKDFLTALRDADATLIEAARQGNAAFPPDGEILAEVIRYFQVLHAVRRRRLTHRAAADLGLEASPLLFALLHADDAQTARTAMTEVLRLQPQGASAALGRLARTARDHSLRTEAAEAARRLRLQTVTPDASVEPVPLPPVEKVLVSMLDGSGTQIVLVVRRVADAAFHFANVMVQDHWGVKDVMGSLRTTTDLVEEIEDRFDEQDLAMVPVDLAAARGIIAAAIDENAATEHGIPPEFELWEMHFHDLFPPPADEPSVGTELEDAPYAGQRGLVEAGGDLADHPAFSSWGFEVDAVLAAMEGVPPPMGTWTSRQYRPLVKRLVPPAERDRLRRNLRRQAWLMDKAGDAGTRDLALATAAAMAGAGPNDLAKLPFLQHLVEHSVSMSINPLGLFDLSGLLDDDDLLDTLDDADLDSFFPLLPPRAPSPSRPSHRRRHKR